MSLNAWELTGKLSPRSTVRVAAVDVSGTILNSYDSTAHVDGEQPETTWAMYLADSTGYRFLVFDIDSDEGESAATAQADLDAVTGLLDEHSIQYVVCASGPSLRRHVWVALSEAVPASDVSHLAYLAERICPSLDKGPMTNPAAGCVRPPGAPHRNGGVSRVLTGDLALLEQPSTTADMFYALLSTLNERYGAEIEAERSPGAGMKDTFVDVDGRLYLPGHRRSLSSGPATALNERIPDDGDASSILWRVLLGAAAARWRFADVAARLESAPGLEHARTTPSGPFRRPRPTTGRQSPMRVLARQWDKAVQQMAGRREQGDDPTFEPRAAAIARHVRELQARADASPGRWHSRGGASDRRILDVLCVLALEAVTGRLEADVRRLALLAGVGRETARTALLRLAEDKWIARAAAADGPHGAQWTIDPKMLLHRPSKQDRSQGDPRPAGAGGAERSLLLENLRGRLDLARHNLFTRSSPALGIPSGNLYSRLSATRGLSVGELVRCTGSPASWVRRELERFVTRGLAVRVGEGWRRTDAVMRDVVAEDVGVAGRLLERRGRYELERVEWAWWRLEYERMTAPGRNRSKRKQLPEQQAFTFGRPWDAFPEYPRSKGRADGRAARDAILAGLIPQFFPVAA